MRQSILLQAFKFIKNSAFQSININERDCFFEIMLTITTAILISRIFNHQAILTHIQIT